MNVKEVYVTREKLADIFGIIESVLSTRPNTQVFVDNKIYEELLKNGLNYHVSPHNYMKTGHYSYNHENSFGGEKWLELTDGPMYRRGSQKIASASFIDNTKEYMQLVEFRSSKVKSYVHYLAGFKQLLLILLKTE